MPRYAAPRDEEATRQSIAAAEALQGRIWSAVMESVADDPSQNVARVLVPALNSMIDITTTRTVFLYVRLPDAILVLLLVVALSSAMTAGYAMARRGRRSILHVVLYATSIAMTLYVILDLEHPRRGVITLESADRILQQLRDSIR